jgi:hypothetical protein
LVGSPVTLTEVVLRTGELYRLQMPDAEPRQRT